MILFDRSIPRSVVDALKLVRSDVLWLEDKFSHDTKDEVWLAEAGREGWVVVGRDKKIRYRPGERRAIEQHAVGYFVVATNRNLTKWEYMRLFVVVLDQINLIFEQNKRPFIYGIYSKGHMRRLV